MNKPDDEYRMLDANEKVPVGTLYEYRSRLDHLSTLSTHESKWKLGEWLPTTEMSIAWVNYVRVHKDHDPKRKQAETVVWRKLWPKETVRVGDELSTHDGRWVAFDNKDLAVRRAVPVENYSATIRRKVPAEDIIEDQGVKYRLLREGDLVLEGYMFRWVMDRRWAVDRWRRSWSADLVGQPYPKSEYTLCRVSLAPELLPGPTVIVNKAEFADIKKTLKVDPYAAIRKADLDRGAIDNTQINELINYGPDMWEP